MTRLARAQRAHAHAKARYDAARSLRRKAALWEPLKTAMTELMAAQIAAEKRMRKAA